MRIGSSLLVDLSMDRPGVIDGLRSQLAGGQVKTGRIMAEIAPGRYQATLGGLKLTFIPTKPLQVGASFTARMEAGQLMLDFPQSETAATEAIPADNRVSVRTLNGVLSDLGLPPEPRLAGLVQGLLQAGVSLTADAVKLFQTHVGLPETGDATLLAFLVQRAIPVDASLLAALKEIFRKGEALNEILPEMFSDAEKTLEKMEQGSEADTLRNLLEQIKQSMPDLKDRQSVQAWQALLREGAGGGGVFREAYLALADKDLPEWSMANLKEGLLQLERWLGQALASDEGNENLKRLQEGVQTGISRIEQLQLASVRAPWDSRHLWVLEIPFQVDGQFESIPLWIEGEVPEDGQESTKQPIRATLYLNLSNLGRLRVSLTLWNEQVQGQVASNDPDVVQFLDQAFADWLTSRKAEQGSHSIQIDSIRVQQIEQEKDLFPPSLLSFRGGGEVWPARVDLEA